MCIYVIVIMDRGRKLARDHEREGKRASQWEGEGDSITRDIKIEWKCWG